VLVVIGMGLGYAACTTSAVPVRDPQVEPADPGREDDEAESLVEADTSA
jgi:hypothetical protein